MILSHSILQRAKNQRPFVITVKTDNAGTSNNDQFTIPTTGTGYNYEVRTSDGQYITGQTGNCTITFPASGTYTVKIYGTFPRIYFNDGGDKLKLLTIAQWGTQKWSSMGSAFHGCINLTGTYTDIPNMSEATSMYRMFRNCQNFNSAVNFSTPNVTAMSATFFDCFAFNQSVSSFDTSKVTSMTGMFYDCRKFNQSVSSFDTSKVTSLSYMFSKCAVFNQSVSSFDTSEVKTMTDLFQGCSAFNQSVANFNTANVTAMEGIFRGCIAFNQSISNFDTAKVTTMVAMFRDCGTEVFKQDLSHLKIDALTDATDMMMGTNINDTGTTTRYDALLVAWAAYTPKNASVSFNAGSTTKYSAATGEPARDILTGAPNNWTIADGGVA